jgi:chemotaxis protein CheZ
MSQVTDSIPSASLPRPCGDRAENPGFACLAKELEAVIAATAAATLEILAATAAIEAAAGSTPPASGDKVQAAATRIYEACCFQDLTGQRIRRVIGHLDRLEQDGDPEARGCGCDPSQGCSGSRGCGQTEVVAGSPSLENGPQPSGVAMDQDDIDAMLFGNG